MKSVFHASVYSLAALAGLILSFAEEQLFPTILTVPLAFLAWFLNEHLKVIRLSVLWSNLLGIAAFGVATFELSNQDTESRVLAGAHLLTYLSWIAMFQKKRGRQYWWMLALGVMQVAVSSILTEKGLFGVLLGVYVFFGLWTLAVFSVFQAQSGFDQAGLRASGSGIDSTDDRRGSLTHRHKDQFRSAIQLDPDQQWVSLRFVTGVVTTSLLSLLIGLAFFTVIPRLWVGRNLSELGDDPRSRLVTGFANEIQLGEIGQILESNKPVLQVRCFDRDENEDVGVEELAARLGYPEPLFRGSVMGRYENGRWTVLKESANVVELLSAQGHQGTRFVQNIILHDGSTNTLFAMHPIRLAEIQPGEALPEIDMVTSILMRPEKARGREPYEYRLHTYIPSRGRKPAIAEVQSAESFRASRRAFHHFLEVPENLNALRTAAIEIAVTTPTNFNGYQRARWIAQQIEHRLRDSGEFTYSLGAAISDPTIDPVEDFFLNRKSGHCEYFASAMALMLRAAGVPSRLVSGFKGGDLIGYSGAYVVEERHAHAWVEVLIGNNWRIFDPTPGEARAASVREIGKDRSTLAELEALITGIWHQRIVRLSFGEQRRIIYEPLAERFRKSDGVNFLSEKWGEVREFASDPTRWFSVTTFVGTFLLAAVLFGTRALWRRLNASDMGLIERLVHAVRNWLERRRERREESRVDFYERFTKILAGHGIRRGRSQTPLEFAGQARQQLDEILTGGDLTGFPDDLVRRFYDVRYGDVVLEPRERKSIGDLLSRLEQTLSVKKKNRVSHRGKSLENPS